MVGEISAYNNQIVFTLTLYEGDMVHGVPKGERCSFEFTLNHCPPEFWPLLDRQLENVARRVVEKEDQAIYAKRIADAATRLAATLSEHTDKVRS